MTEIGKDDIILQAAIEFGPDYLYSIKDSNMGPTLYVEVNNKDESNRMRKEIPHSYEGLRTIVICSERIN
jgi:hypothetical protein